MNRNGNLVGGSKNRLVLRDTLKEEASLKANRRGNVYGEISINYEKIHFYDFCRGKSVPVLVRLTFDDTRLKDLTNDKVHKLDRISREFHYDADDEWYDDEHDDEHDGRSRGDKDDGFIRLLVP